MIFFQFITVLFLILCIVSCMVRLIRMWRKDGENQKILDNVYKMRYLQIMCLEESEQILIYPVYSKLMKNIPYIFRMKNN